MRTRLTTTALLAATMLLPADLAFSVPNSIVLTKTVGTDPGSCADTMMITVPADTDVTYCYRVQNTGAITLTLHDLFDNQLGQLLDDFPFTLTPSASVFLTQTAFITQTTANTATWTAFNPDFTDVTSDTADALVEVEDDPDGAECMDASTCQSDFCVDGVCCNTACDELNEACNIPGNEGVCIDVTAQAPALSRVGLLVSGLVLLVLGAVAITRRRTLSSLS